MGTNLFDDSTDDEYGSEEPDNMVEVDDDDSAVLGVFPGFIEAGTVEDVTNK